MSAPLGMCSQLVHDHAGAGHHGCPRRAVVVENGKPLCNLHRESAVRARAKKSEETWERNYRRAQAVYGSSDPAKDLRIAELERELAAMTKERDDITDRYMAVAQELEGLRSHADALAEALQKLCAAEDASSDEFTAKEIDAIESAMDAANKTLAAYRASQQPKP